MSTPAHKRLLKDLQKIKKEEDEGINAAPLENNIFKWTAII
jgi:ubiquitin-protein ligase